MSLIRPIISRTRNSVGQVCVGFTCSSLGITAEKGAQERKFSSSPLSDTDTDIREGPICVIGTYDFGKNGSSVVSEDTLCSIQAAMALQKHVFAGSISSVSSGYSRMPIHVVFGGSSSNKVCENMVRVYNTERVETPGRDIIAMSLDDDRLNFGVAEATSESLVALHSRYKYRYIMGADTSYCRNILPRVGALLDVEPVHGVVEILGHNSFERAMYAGNVLGRVSVNSDTILLTVRSSNFQPEGDIVVKHVPCDVEDLLQGSAILDSPPAVRIEGTTGDSAKMQDKNLSHAKIVVAGGRAFQSKEHFKKLRDFADSIGAAVGATRAIVDAGIAPNDIQIGQTGKIVAPDVYIAFGISGAIQHMAGVKDSKCIIAINNDEEAPIFNMADYGLVSDVDTVLDDLIRLKTR